MGIYYDYVEYQIEHNGRVAIMKLIVGSEANFFPTPSFIRVFNL